MKPLSQLEIEHIAVELKAWLGAQLQELVLFEKAFGIYLFRGSQSRWLWFDASTPNPFLFSLETPPKGKKIERPVLLYARAHLRGQRLLNIMVEAEQGRVLRLDFEHGYVRYFLIPRMANLEVGTGDRAIFWRKPVELKNIPFTGEMPQPRSWSELHKEWLADKGAAGEGDGGGAKSAADFQKKFEKTLQKIKDDLARRESLPWAELAEWLKQNQNNKVPAEWMSHIDALLPWQKNMDTAFAKARDNREKIAAQKKRIAELQCQLESQLQSGFALEQTRPDGRTKKSLLEAASARGRTLHVKDLIGYLGKSGADNLKILRKSQPFDLWLHLKDYPGAHLVIRRAKGRNVTDGELQEFARWLISQTVPKAKSGGRFDMLVAECRFVRPIKGDKLGRVNYSDERVLPVRA